MEKKKKILLIILSVVIIGVIIVIAVSLVIKNNENLQQKFNYYNQNRIVTAIEEMQGLDQSKPMVVLFHSPACAGCRSFQPVFNQLSKELSKDYNFMSLNINEPQNYPLVMGNVGGIPTLCIFDSTIGNKVHISLASVRSYNELKAEFERYIKIRSFIDLKKAQEAHQKQMNQYGIEISKIK